MAETEFTEEEMVTKGRLEQMVEARCPGAGIEMEYITMHIPGVWRIRVVTNGEHPLATFFTASQEGGLQMAAAAVCARELWPLVEAAREWEEAREALESILARGHSAAEEDFARGVEIDTSVRLRTALARLDGKSEEESK